MSGGSHERPWSAVRARLGQSPFGHWLRRRRQVQALRSWTDEDEARRSFYATFIASDDLVFDVGANVGNRTKVFLRLGAQVVAIEPQRTCVSMLAKAFERDPRVTIVHDALGASIGTAEMRLSDADTISSMSSAWIDAVRRSGRFSSHHWQEVVTVEVTTLDALIDRHGSPSFVKIDVEGYELEVLRGLTRPVQAISFEHTPECTDASFACIAHLESLGFDRFNYSVGESMRLEHAAWITAAELRERLGAMRGDASTFGDIYARSPR